MRVSDEDIQGHSVICVVSADSGGGVGYMVALDTYWGGDGTFHR